MSVMESVVRRYCMSRSSAVNLPQKKAQDPLRQSRLAHSSPDSMDLGQDKNSSVYGWVVNVITVQAMKLKEIGLLKVHLRSPFWPFAYTVSLISISRNQKP